MTRTVTPSIRSRFFRYSFLLSALSAGTLASQAQSTTAVQEFESAAVTNSDTELGYFGNPTLQAGLAPAGWTNAGSPLYSNGLRSWSVSNTTETLLFRGRRTQVGSVNNYIQFRVAAWGKISNEGLDESDFISVSVSVDGGVTYANTLLITGQGSGDSFWNFESPAPSPRLVNYSSTGTTTITPPNAGGKNKTGNGYDYYRINNLPAGAQSIRFYITASNDNINEVWTIDQVTIGSSAPLPVELKSFTADATANGTQVRWSTASEKDNAGFEVQRGASSDKFETIARIAGHGTTTQARSYEWLDSRPLAGMSYYRLRQTDTDGTETFSPVVAVKSGSKAAAFYPNPTTGSVVLAPELGAVHYRILNALGQALQSGESSGGSTIDVRALQAGSYFLELQTASGRQVQRFLREM